MLIRVRRYGPELYRFRRKVLLAHGYVTNRNNVFLMRLMKNSGYETCLTYYLASTKERHVMGAMASMNGSLIVMGGSLYQGADTNVVEVL